MQQQVDILCIRYTDAMPMYIVYYVIAESIKYDGDGAFTIAEYGSADGGTSMFVMRDCIGKE